MPYLTLFTADAVAADDDAAAAAHGPKLSRPPPNSLICNYFRKEPDLEPNLDPDPISEAVSSSSAVPTSLEKRVPAPDQPEPSARVHYPPPPDPPTLIKKRRRTKTSYCLAQPPPGAHFRHRHSLRAERALIVQLQRLSNASRPIPTFDVLPASIFGSKFKMIGQRLHGAVQQDVVFVTSEQYSSSSGRNEEEDGSDDDADLNSRRVVASISQTHRRTFSDEAKGTKTTMIRLDEGSPWEASPLASGGYEFVAHDPDGTMRVAKWLPKIALPRRRSSQSFQRHPSLDPEERRFQFSILDPVTRKKPIMAWMNRHSIDVLDYHPSPSLTSPSTTPPTSPATSDAEFDLSAEDLPDQAYRKVPEALRNFIVVTGTWVALREGIASNNGRIDETVPPPLATPPSSVRKSHSRPISGTFSGSENGHVSEEPARKKLFRHGTTVAHDATTGAREIVPRRAKSMGSTSSGLVRLSRTFGKSPGVPPAVLETSRPSVEVSRTGPVEPLRVRVPSDQPVGSPDSPTVGCVSKSFPGRNRHTISAPIIYEPTDDCSGTVGETGRCGSVIEIPKDREKRRFGLKAMVSSIFRPRRAPVSV